jgi:hypothetical protein
MNSNEARKFKASFMKRAQRSPDPMIISKDEMEIACPGHSLFILVCPNGRRMTVKTN